MLYLTCDHGGYETMQKIMLFLKKEKIEFEYCGPKSYEKTDGYPMYARMANLKVSENEDNKGLYVCGTGLGIAMAANRNNHIRAALCLNKKYAYASRRHNNANVLVLPGSYYHLPMFKIKQIIKTFLNTEFEGGRHIARIKEIS